ncbi:MAG: FtsX-like permease family protein [Dehalococcoidia bacterium]|nr:FtsX-like permease family protein [Dehalococcoidia bacterium]
MTPLDALKTAYRSLTGSALRSTLTVLGIVIGITSVIALMSVGRGASAQITSQIESIGTNLLFVSPLQATSSGARGTGEVVALTLDDAKALADPTRAPSIAAVAPQVGAGGQLIVGSNNMRAQITGVTPEFAVIRNYQLQSGDFITEQQNTSRQLVMVIGATVATTLFPNGDDPVGQNIRINNRTFQVIGVLQAKGGNALGNQDSAVYVPLNTALVRLTNSRSVRGSPIVNTITLQAASRDSLDAVKAEASVILREQHRLTGDDDFQITSQQDLINTTSQITGVFTIVLGAIAGISLLVGGIGIMNIMLVSVVERTREIGLRKAVGAKQRDILIQFLVESMLLSLTGGVLGVALGYLGAHLLSGVQFNSNRLNTVVSADIVILAVSVSIIIGLFFGIFPASRAARLDPIECLRHE